MSQIPEQISNNDRPQQKGNNILKWVGILLLVYLLIAAVGMISLGFKSVTGEGTEKLFAFATNPFSGLIIGTLATALIQSSSTVTSITVGLVAGGLPVVTAIPIIMGANIGTTITNTLVSLGHIGDKEEFKRAFAAATIHDFFNLISVVLFLPLEIIFHPLEQMGLFLAQGLVGGSSLSLKGFNLVTTVTKPVVNFFSGITHVISPPLDGAVLILMGVALIFFSIVLMGKLLKVLMVGRAKGMLYTTIGRDPMTGIVAGTVITILVQSSSTTTSLMVPLAGSGVLGLSQIYPFTLGANMGTCITALLAATAISGNQAVPALEIAMIHMLYNFLGVVVIYGIPFLRQLPVIGAQKLADVASERKYLAVVYILGVFFVIPIILLGLSTLTANI
ncbi:Na/Pi symporter [Calothrix rhizosoleniae]|uniref:Na/Pi symporter n=1 Tax=Calothrix rhizosoleniae TaxID=888997 RepID=UPI000B49C120|nr:Na/Pi symporter [Calothrix rhizosoleniae]